MKKAIEPITALKALVDLHEGYSPADWDEDWVKPWKNVVAVVKNATPPIENEDINDRLFYTPYEVGDLLKELYHDCEHGDEEHRKWLKDKIEHFYSIHIEIHKSVKNYSK